MSNFLSVGKAGTVKNELEVLIRARYPVIYVESWEEERVSACLSEIAVKLGKSLIMWSEVRGFHTQKENGPGKIKIPFTSEASAAPLKALAEVAEQRDAALYLFKDFHVFFSEKQVLRRLREVAQQLRTSLKTLIFVSHSVTIPEELSKDITVVTFPLPEEPEIATLLSQAVAQAFKSGRGQENLSEDTQRALIAAARGLTLHEAENAFARTLIACGRISAQEIKVVLNEKKQSIKKSGLLEYIDTTDNLQQVGGLASLKDWVDKRRVAFSEAARRFGLPAPKGVLLLGVQGCGKSLSARAISQVWQLPLLRLDAGRIFEGLIGSSEANVRRAIAAAESLAPVILWIDEIEKAFAGVRSGESDGGTSSRVFATFLTWLQEKKEPVFVVATANSIDKLPPELLRKGRFDEIFFVDLPDYDERKAIFAIHLQRRGRDTEKFALDSLAQCSEGFSGSEIEQAVIGALYDAFALNRDINTADIVTILQQTVPLSVTLSEEIEHSRAWARSRARSAR